MNKERLSLPWTVSLIACLLASFGLASRSLLNSISVDDFPVHSVIQAPCTVRVFIGASRRAQDMLL